MTKVAAMWVQMTLVALVTYLLVTNAKGTAGIIGAAGNAYATSVKSFTNPTGLVGNAARR